MGLGLVLGGLLTHLVELLPESTARSFLTSSVEPSFGPFSADLLVFDFTVGPVSLAVNVLTLVGIATVAFIVRSWM